MVWLIVFPKMFASTMQAGFYRCNARAKGLGDFGVAAAFLDEGEQDAILRPELGEGVAEGVELLGADGAGRLGDVLMLGREREKDPAEFLPAEVVDAGVAREAEEPGLELFRRLKPGEGADHFDENLLRDVLHGVAAPDDGVDESGHPVLVRDDEFALGVGFAALGAADKVDQLGRRSWFHAVGIAIASQTRERR
jgi:hypothetical protein